VSKFCIRTFNLPQLSRAATIDFMFVSTIRLPDWLHQNRRSANGLSAIHIERCWDSGRKRDCSAPQTIRMRAPAHTWRIISCARPGKARRMSLITASGMPPEENPAAQSAAGHSKEDLWPAGGLIHGSGATLLTTAETTLLTISDWPRVL
jgi:hypothetical protein